ncbi:MAG: hypothetical protein KDA80_05750 [Planctomycetaceae bacterium]|nr:hypothetical protein [Planctomycetaceae bacterium]
MIWKRLKTLFRQWPADVPRLYPKLSDIEIADYLTKERYLRIKNLPTAYILPFFGEESPSEVKQFGTGLSRLMIRNLMLLPDVSIHGYEDTPEFGVDALPRLSEVMSSAFLVGGKAGHGNQGFALKFQVYHEGREILRDSVRIGDFHAFLRDCTVAIGNALGSKLKPIVADAWEVGQPSQPFSLKEYGRIVTTIPGPSRERSKAAATLLKKDPAFVVPVWSVDSGLPASRQIYFDALERDPYNAQLCFETFCMVWNSRGSQPEALQYCRRAIDLSPGHGKAHMCFPHAAPDPAQLWRHSELGYLLLPGNSFAVSNYMVALMRAKRPVRDMIMIAKMAITSDPENPSPFQVAIAHCIEMKAYREALMMAENLQILFEPYMSERTRYCLRQNPERVRQMDSGEYDPATENRKLIKELRELAR